MSSLLTDFNKKLFEDMDTQRPSTRNSFEMFRAVHKGDLKTVTELISDNPDWDEGHYLLCEAIERDHRTAELLISRGADVNSRSRDVRTTALTLAVKIRNKGFVQMLIDGGAEVNAKNADDSTALHCASKMNILDIALQLIQHKADINARDDRKQTPLTFAVLNNSISMIDTLVQYGADVNAKSENGSILLHTAVQKCHLDTVKCLLTKNIDVNAMDYYNRDALYLAIIRGDEAIVYYLVEAGASISTYYDHMDGRKMPLHVACLYDKEPIVEMLLCKGADVHALSEHDIRTGDGCIYTIYNYGENESKMTPLHCAAFKGNRKICEKLLMNGADVNARTAHGYTPLHLGTGCDAVVELLLRSGADINATAEDGLTCLHFAARGGTTFTIGLLLEKGASVNARSRTKLTPLHLAAEKGEVEKVRVILNYRADVDAVDINGNTPLHFAVESDETVLALIDHKCDINIENNYKDAAIRMDVFADNLRVIVKKYSFEESNPRQSGYTREYYRTFNTYTTSRFYRYLKKVIHTGAEMANSNARNFRLLTTHQCRSLWNFYMKSPQEEVEKMKTTKISKTNITYYDILTEPIKKIIPYVRNENVVQAMTTHSLYRQFPLHEYLIRSRFNTALDRQKFLDDKAKFFSAGFIPNLRMDLPDVCVGKIFSHLGDEDLSNLKDAFEGACTINVKGKK